ncbi:AGE family epimerase/isomerase [Vibrio scophthalmi]|uniref:glucose-6-phosphate isomerase n=1 Tax=Vibrio scophthalmi TaxID=45658 RepID=A0A1E3WL97_9VIBR|nr:AGE family epimerase/isomerase [Vibrio scophthalmi]ODS10546.1 Mannose-6-phosphate isomerase [Vibrio scophthalmi]
MNSLEDQILRCRHWLTHHALPIWLTSQDNQSGLFAEGIMYNGELFDSNQIRFRVQPRQAYVYSHATLLGFIDANQSIDRVIKQGFDTFGSIKTGYRFSTAPSEESGSINLYEQAFSLLGFAWYYRLNRDNSSFECMEATYQFIVEHFYDPIEGGFFLTLGDKTKKSQNPHMHLFEALMVCFEHTNDSVWLERASNIYQLFTDHFLRDGHLTEFFNRDFTLDNDIGDNLDPGHHYEWIWLLNHYQKLSGTNVDVAVNKLNQFATQFGHNTNGLVRDEILASGEPLRVTSRLWCQTEYLKATIALWERDPTSVRRTEISRAVEQIFTYFLNPASSGLWIDQVDECGGVCNEHSPASTFYHIFLAFSEVLKLDYEAAMHSTTPVINYTTGRIVAGQTVCKQTKLSALYGVFMDESAFNAQSQDTVIYQVEMLPPQDKEGELNFGVSHIEPGVIGQEFYMTRGHIHQRKEQAEYYFGSQGEGLLLMQTETGELSIEKVFPGSVHHIPGYVAHRLVNTGNTVLSALAVWPAVAGHDYDFVNSIGFKVRVMKAHHGYELLYS